MKKYSAIVCADNSAGANINNFLPSVNFEKCFAIGEKNFLNSDKVDFVQSEKYISNGIFSEILNLISTDYFFLISSGSKIEFKENAIEKFINSALKKNSGLTYSDYCIVDENNRENEIPCIDYQSGSIRDNFDFGCIYLFNTNKTRNVIEKYGVPADDSFEIFFYDLRLKIATDYEITHISDLLYSKYKTPSDTEDKHFSYVAKENFNRQKTLETIASAHLKRIGAFLLPVTKKVKYDENKFLNIASIVIPVRNREKTIADAVMSALNQKTDFPFNVIVIDNHSTDKTTETLKGLAEKNRNLLHIIPEKNDLQIGGCWNEAVLNDNAGMFCVQLDSDDIYINECTLQKIVNAFYETGASALVGSYSLVDFNLNSIPPGLIDHKEWTDENGHNNGLRINGFGAPRAYYTPVIRELLFPNVSYGEDYSVMIRITRNYYIARIYESLYYCRRWENNSDSNISVQTLNKFNFYKDSLRTAEIKERIELNKKYNQEF